MIALMKRFILSDAFVVLVIFFIGISGIVLTIRGKIAERKVVLEEITRFTDSIYIVGVDFSIGYSEKHRVFCFTADRNTLNDVMLFFESADTSISPSKYRRSMEFSISVKFENEPTSVFSAVIFENFPDDVFVRRESGKALPSLGPNGEGHYLIRLPDFANWATSKFKEHGCI